MIALEGVSKRFAGRLVLERTTLSVAAGASLALVGPSGCGKSTLLRIVLGLVQPDEGRSSVEGIPVTADTAIAVRRRAGYVIQDGGLFPHLTARDNATLLARHLRWAADRIERRVLELTSLTGLDRDTLSRYPGEISGGQRQRVGIMRALMLDPPVLLLDEPMGALDPMIRAKLQEDLKRIFLELGKTVLLVTHDLKEAAYLGDEVALMRAGRVLQRGSMRELIETPADPFVHEFIELQRPPCR
ncbi:MAG: ATP-binding cassette domain-containing protein [Myxococcota bacterium]|nr:ATP-binding cassette domain-containing protein [Myxococcota bacterium]